MDSDLAFFIYLHFTLRGFPRTDHSETTGVPYGTAQPSYLIPQNLRPDLDHLLMSTVLRQRSEPQLVCRRAGTAAINGTLTKSLPHNVSCDPSVFLVPALSAK